MRGVAVQITISGRIGPTLRAALRDLDVEVVSRHNVMTLGSDQVPDLVLLLDAMERRAVEFDRIVRSEQ